MDRNSRFLPLRTKLALRFALLSIISVGIITLMYYQNTRAQLRQDIRERLRDAVAIGALQIDAQAHSQLTSPDQEGTPAYLRLKKTLQNIRDAGTNIRFVYTMRQDAQGKILFIVDAEESEADVSHLGDIYDDAGPLLTSNFATMTSPMVENDFYTDKWGTWLTGYAPFYGLDGRREGILGMDISANYILAEERKIFWRALMLFIIASASATVIGWILGAFLAAPISKLTEAAGKLSSGKLDYRLNIKTRDEIGALSEAFNATAEKLDSLVSNLERRVEERTTALTRKTSQLEAATQVARRAAAIKDTAILLNDTVRLISDQFGFYHAGLFLLDEKSEYAVLQAASSEGGKRMLIRGHRLQVGGQGIVGYVAAQKRPRIALDTGADAVYFDNPDLPETRSEAALPLILRERVIGVLDIQSVQPQAFTAEDIETFQTLADQLALAIENTRLFNEMNVIVEQFEQTADRRVQEAWNKPSLAKTPAYQYTPLGTQSIAHRHASIVDSSRLKIPITLRDQTIGEINVKRKDEGNRWDPREQTMLEEIATQVGLALENARLLDEAQQRAVRERSVSDITTRIGSAHDIEAILRVTAHEIGKALGDSEVTVQIRGKELENL